MSSPSNLDPGWMISTIFGKAIILHPLGFQTEGSMSSHVQNSSAQHYLREATRSSSKETHCITIASSAFISLISHKFMPQTFIKHHVCAESCVRYQVGTKIYIITHIYIALLELQSFLARILMLLPSV